MPRTLACFLLALLVLTVALVLPRPARCPDPGERLELAGVHTVEISVRGMPNVRFSASQAPRLSVPGDGRDRLSVNQADGRLVLRSDDPAYLGLSLVLPPSVKTLKVDGADISVDHDLVLDRLDVEATSTVYWSGDAGILNLRDMRRPAAPTAPDAAADAAADVGPDRLPGPVDNYCAGDCGSMFHINRGRIDLLEVELTREGIEINRTDTLGGATLRLGERAWLGLGHARRVEHLQILPLAPGSTQDAAAAPEQATETAEDTP